ncbi:MAG: 2,5-diamino-6-(ribosylamino)-4(3H)-pyrimidinone 5'-phosphate reductase [Thermoplasmata archaeon M9B1D]|nr:MAG: 2,5-diamino-6-(ribosylamino)-4(3H)-pyrimidinone 5'-phosphate reductase [Thermoplasmata archaeon M9B1D]PNX51286.1 MAG: 2,5-diamino-6-(ribosylamino)-4(3H)-pyrimidinone 5'-phosphate reductase [Thermoplasmata archaeon M8B2D]
MNRPYIIINCAMSADGKIASSVGSQLRISNNEDMRRVYNLRNEFDAVLVGVNTIQADNPKLTIKEEYVQNPKNPIRVILDTHCITNEDALAVDEQAKTLIITNGECDKNYKSNVEVVQCGVDYEGFIDLNQMLEILYNRGIRKLMVEGGGTVIWNFLKLGLVDDLFVFIGPMIIGGKCTPSMADGEGINQEDELINLEILEFRKIGNGLLIHYKMVK